MKQKFWIHNKIYFIIFLIILVATSIFGVGYFYFQQQINKSNSQVQQNLEKAKRTLEAIPVWHKKIQTKQELKFGIITDTHVEPKNVGTPIPASQMQPIYAFVKDMLSYKPEFIVNLGDVIDGSHETPPVGMFGLRSVKKAMKRVGVPTYFVIGNHDLRSVTKEQFRETLDIPDFEYTFDVGDYRFVILDANYLRDYTSRSPNLPKRYIPGIVPPDNIKWLKEQLKTDKRVIVFIHQGVFATRTPGDIKKRKKNNDDDYRLEEQEVNEITDKDWAKKTYKFKSSVQNANELRKIFDEYRVSAVFNGHMEARRFEKTRWTSFYSLTGTRKSKTFPKSFYEVDIKNGIPNVTMYYTPKYQNQAKQVDFEDKSNIIRERHTLVKGGAGLEWNDKKWIVVGGERGIVFADDMRQYINKSELEGIAMCNQKYYIGKEDKNELLILDNKFKDNGNISLDDLGKNISIEGVACAENNNLHVITKDNIYRIDLSGKLQSVIKLKDKELSFADYNQGILYVISRKDNVILLLKNDTIIDEIPIKQQGQVRGIKASSQIINIIL